MDAHGIASTSLMHQTQTQSIWGHFDPPVVGCDGTAHEEQDAPVLRVARWEKVYHRESLLNGNAQKLRGAEPQQSVTWTLGIFMQG